VFEFQKKLVEQITSDRVPAAGHSVSITALKHHDEKAACWNGTRNSRWDCPQPRGFWDIAIWNISKYKWMRIRSFPPEDDLLPLTGPLPLHLLPFHFITALNPSNMDFIQQTREPVNRSYRPGERPDGVADGHFPYIRVNALYKLASVSYIMS
jgi:hypothetical protein